MPGVGGGAPGVGAGHTSFALHLGHSARLLSTRAPPRSLGRKELKGEKAEAPALGQQDPQSGMLRLMLGSGRITRDLPS